jgi:hypothetical protein
MRLCAGEDVVKVLALRRKWQAGGALCESGCRISCSRLSVSFVLGVERRFTRFSRGSNSVGP